MKHTFETRARGAAAASWWALRLTLWARRIGAGEPADDDGADRQP